MKKLTLFVACILSIGWLHAQVSNNNEDEVYKLVNPRTASMDFVPGQVLVKMKDGSPASVRRNARGKFQSAGISNLDKVLQEFGVEEMEQLLPRAKASRTPRRAKAYNGDIIEERDLTQLYRIVLPEEKADQTLQMVEKLETLSEVEYAEPNYKLYLMEDASIASLFNSNPFVYQQWYLDAYGVKHLWNKPIINPKRPVIAIIDTGVDMTHPDLVDNLWTNTAEAEGEEGYDNDGNGFKSDVHGWDFVNNTPNVRDNNMHGTHVAGIAAAANNGIGIIGANPQALIMPVSVMQSDGTGDVATIVRGIDYAVQNGADVLNLSLGTYANSRAMRQSLERAYQSAVIVAAAGNDGRCVNSSHLHYPTPAPAFPAAYSFVLGVQATQQNGSLAGFSNFDDDGNTFSAVTTLHDPDGFNYELMAPGANILSTIPGGKYKVLNGTSMAAPLVAGAISALKMVKQYDTQEILWGDLLHTNNIAEAYAVTNRPAELDMLNMQMRNRKELVDETEEDYSGDHEIDAGETVSIYPVIRTTFGEASNIKMHLEMGDEFEDPNTVEILTGEVDFGMHLDAYGKGVSLNPMQVKIADNIADGRHIKLKIVATCDESIQTYEWPFTVVVTNMVKISGLITEDRTLTADHVYYVNEDLGIMEGVTLTIEPGTCLEFAEGKGLRVNGKLVAVGNVGNPIIFTSKSPTAYWNGICTSDTIFYATCENVNITGNNTIALFKNSILRNFHGGGSRNYSLFPECYYSNIIDCTDILFGKNEYTGKPKLFDGNHNNIVNNSLMDYPFVSGSFPEWSDLKHSNYMNNFMPSFSYSLGIISVEMRIDKSEAPSYLGTSKESNIRPYIYEIGNSLEAFGSTFVQTDLSNMLTEPISEAHGIVWKVCVNGKDAQDEYEDLAPLGVGKHKFEVYFNRPMNKEVAPQISFGVRDPWTQNAVAEEGSWNEEGTIYTAYKTIDGKTKSDGVNRIYVWGAEDNEYFEIPYEKTRFNINIQAAGSMATGFAAEAGLGKVDLTWNNDENDFDDAMGFNIYRYTEEEKLMPVRDEWGNEVWGYDENGNWVRKEAMQTVRDTVCLNREIVDIETTEYTDYDVTPGQTYYYYYKVLSTDLKEYDVSNVVAATPLTATLGDANGSGDVDVADVITTVNQITGMEPKPFIFEAADVNVDLMIDVLDVIGIIQKILNPGANTLAMSEAEATYTIEDGTLYVESPVALAGVQVQLSLTSDPSPVGEGRIIVAEDLKGFEHTSAWLSDNDYLFLAYNMNGKTLTPGKHALLHIGDAMIAQIRLSDANGHNVLVTGDDATKVNRMASDVMTIPGIYDMQGRKLSGNTDDVKLPKGVYIINGQKVVR